MTAKPTDPPGPLPVPQDPTGSLADGLDYESYLHALTCATEDKREGLAAFLEKRKPVFHGR